MNKDVDDDRVLDMFKHPLKVGDKVLSVYGGRNDYVVKAIVVGFTAKRVKVAELSRYSENTIETMKTERQLIKIDTIDDEDFKELERVMT